MDVGNPYLTGLGKSSASSARECEIERCVLAARDGSMLCDRMFAALIWQLFLQSLLPADHGLKAGYSCERGFSSLHPNSGLPALRRGAHFVPGLL
jgi:hypothetical protein